LLAALIDLSAAQVALSTALSVIIDLKLGKLTHADAGQMRLSGQRGSDVKWFMPTLA
jgi:hypothetical protein